MTTADLHIPDAAIAALAEVAIPGAFDDDPRGHVADVAAPVVAAELRHMAGWFGGQAKQLLLDRAEELDPPQLGGDH